MKTGLMAFAAAVAMSVASVAFADGASVHIDLGSCEVGDANLNIITIYPPALGGDAIVQSVVTDHGNAKLTCSGTLPEGAILPETGAKVFTKNDGLTCTIRDLPADGHVILVVTSSGQVMLNCQIKASEL
jgi:hypothetical protein